jgi:hypothetical protein
LYEAAGVDHHKVGIVFIAAYPIAGFREKSEHVLCIHAIFFAAQMGEGHRWPFREAVACFGVPGHGMTLQSPSLRADARMTPMLKR